MKKVFCIGLHKTGTSSMAQALRKLGYRVIGPRGRNDPNISQNVYKMAYALVDQYDALPLPLGPLPMTKPYSLLTW